MSNMQLTTQQQETFENLQKPTMSLIGSFYDMPADLKGTFASMMAAYEANPTSENAKKISDIVNGQEAPSVKKARILAYAAKVPSNLRASAKRKYLDERQPVPAGMPTSGMFLVGLGVISREEKEALMDAQAACRLLNMTLNPQMVASQTTVPSPNCKLTRMQHLERIVHNVVAISFEQSRLCVKELNSLFHHANDPDKVVDARPMACLFLSENAFVQKAKSSALMTLQETSKKIKNPSVSKRIDSLSIALLLEVLESDLVAQDYKELIDNVSGYKGAEVIAHHSRRILDLENQRSR